MLATECSVNIVVGFKHLSMLFRFIYALIG